MKILLLILLAATSSLFCNVKEEIAELQQKIGKKGTSRDYYALSLAYLEDQEQDKAFQTFLKALEGAPSNKGPEVENALCQEAYALYFEGAAESENVIKTYEKIVEEHPDYHRLASLVAVCWANLGNFHKFFELFYEHYDADSFLTLKAKAVLHLRLSLSAKTEEERLAQREEAIKLLKGALEKSSCDPGIFRQMVLIAKEKQDKKSVIECLEKLVKSDVKIGRGEILFYVNESCACGRKDLGELVLKKAKEHYAYSRAIEAAEGALKNAR